MAPPSTNEETWPSDTSVVLRLEIERLRASRLGKALERVWMNAPIGRRLIAGAKARLGIDLSQDLRSLTLALPAARLAA